jgi:hypothetical protein
MAAETSPQADRDHFLDSAGGAFVAGKTLSTFDDVARILNGVAANSPANGLVLHFHGGLVSRDYALADIVPRLSKLYLDAGAYPLFFVWESGLKETLLNNKEELLTDPTFRELVKKVTEWALRKATTAGTVMVRGDAGAPIEDVGTYRKQFDEYFDGKRDEPPVPDARDAGGTLAPVTRDASIDEDDLAQQIQQELEAGFDSEFNEAIGQAYNALVPPAEVTTKGAKTGTTGRAQQVLLDEAARDEMFPPQPGDVKTRSVFSWLAVAKYVAKIVIAVVKRYRHDRDHGVYCTVVEEVLRSAFLDLVGSNVWNQMKSDTQESFHAGNYCGTAVVTRLRELQQNGQGVRKLTLVGHSTGAIYICNFLDAAKSAGLSFDDVQVIFLAPAVTCWRFADAIRAHGDGYLKNFRMFAMHDERESEDVLVPILYTRSLLYFVSGLLEGRVHDEAWQGILDMPLVGMERFFELAHKATFADDEDVQTVLTFLEGDPHRTVWSRSMDAGDGLNSDSKKHGDFDDDEATLTSVVKIIER